MLPLQRHPDEAREYEDVIYAAVCQAVRYLFEGELALLLDLVELGKQTL